jgi:hypothetical protein
MPPFHRSEPRGAGLDEMSTRRLSEIGVCVSNRPVLPTASHQLDADSLDQMWQQTGQPLDRGWSCRRFDSSSPPEE